jgi:hypothetical protein
MTLLQKILFFRMQFGIEEQPIMQFNKIKGEFLYL